MTLATILAFLAISTHTVDGDTIRATAANGTAVKVRLYGIDAPEGKQAWGKASAAYLDALLDGQPVEVIPIDIDRYSRTVARLEAGGEDVGAALVSAGMAWVHPKYCRLPICDEMYEREKEARDGRLGLWWSADPVPPWDWRRK